MFAGDRDAAFSARSHVYTAAINALLKQISTMQIMYKRTKAEHREIMLFPQELCDWIPGWNGLEASSLSITDDDCPFIDSLGLLDLTYYDNTSASPLLVNFIPRPAGVINTSTLPDPTSSCK